jgi:hypothetical protein
MQWLLALETDNDPITICRLMNSMRRKSVKLVNFSLAAAGGGFSVVALVETRATELDHVFHFVRRTEGVEQVSCYIDAGEEESGSEAVRGNAENRCFLVDKGVGALTPAAAEALTGAKVVLAGQGKLLLEFGTAGRMPHPSKLTEAFDRLEMVCLTCVHSTKSQPVSELVA